MKFTEDQILGEAETPIQFLDENEKALFHEARLGEEAICFLESDLGKLISARANLDIQEAQASLLDVDPEDTATIRRLQFKAAVARQFPRWLADAVRNGDDAYAELQQMR